jgi:hypothetical protein
MAQISPDQITGLFKNMPFDLMQPPPVDTGMSGTSASMSMPKPLPTFTELIALGMPAWEAEQILTNDLMKQIKDKKAVEVAQKEQVDALKNAQRIADTMAFNLSVGTNPDTIFQKSLDPNIAQMVTTAVGQTPDTNTKEVMLKIAPPPVRQDPINFGKFYSPDPSAYLGIPHAKIPNANSVKGESEVLPATDTASDFERKVIEDERLRKATWKNTMAAFEQKWNKASDDPKTEVVRNGIKQEIIMFLTNEGNLGEDDKFSMPENPQQARGWAEEYIKGYDSNLEQVDKVADWSIQRDRLYDELKEGTVSVEQAVSLLAEFLSGSGWLQGSEIIEVDSDNARRIASGIVDSWNKSEAIPGNGASPGEETYEQNLGDFKPAIERLLDLDKGQALPQGLPIASMPLMTQYNLIARRSLGPRAYASGVSQRINDQYMPTLGGYVLQVLSEPQWGEPYDPNMPEKGINLWTSRDRFDNWAERGFKESPDEFWNIERQNKNWRNLVNAPMGGTENPEESHYVTMAQQDTWMKAAAMRVAGIDNAGIFGKLRKKNFDRILDRYYVEQAYAAPEERMNLPKYLSQIPGSPWAKAAEISPVEPTVIKQIDELPN